MLVVSPQSWHFAYFCWIRSLYGSYTVPDRLSLCRYCQTMLWGSIGAIAFSPVILIGWLASKLINYFNHHSRSSYITRFLDWLDQQLLLEDSVGVVEQTSKEGWTCGSVVLHGFLYAFLSLAILFIGATVLLFIFLLFYGAGYGAWHIHDILQYVTDALVRVGWCFWEVLAAIGLVMHLIRDGTVWLFTNKLLWLNIAIYASYVICGIVAVGIPAIFIGWVLMRISQMTLVKRISKSIANRAALSRQKQCSKPVKAKVSDESKPWTCSFCGYINKDRRYFCATCSSMRLPYPRLRRYLHAIFGGTSYSFRYIKDGLELGHHVLNGWGLIWEYLKALKHGVCPLLRVATPRQLQAELLAETRSAQRIKDQKGNHLQLTEQMAKDVANVLKEFGGCSVNVQNIANYSKYHDDIDLGPGFAPRQWTLMFKEPLEIGYTFYHCHLSKNERHMVSTNQALRDLYYEWLLTGQIV